MPDGLRAKRDQENKRIASEFTKIQEMILERLLIGSRRTGGWIPTSDVPATSESNAR
jgi:hypothetical protein